MKYIIKDWTNKTCFNGIEFDGFEEAWGYIYENDPCPSEEQESHWFDDYYVELKDGEK